MMKKNAEDYIKAILRDVEKTKNVDYADKAAVRRNNAAVNRIIANGNYIDEHFPEQFDLLAALMEIEEYEVVGHILPMMFRMKNSTAKHKLRALEVTQWFIDSSDAPGYEKFIFKVNLRTWKKQLVEEGILSDE